MRFVDFVFGLSREPHTLLFRLYTLGNHENVHLNTAFDFSLSTYATEHGVDARR